jgi:hypothetical protein
VACREVWRVLRDGGERGQRGRRVRGYLWSARPRVGIGQHPCWLVKGWRYDCHPTCLKLPHRSDSAGVDHPRLSSRHITTSMGVDSALAALPQICPISPWAMHKGSKRRCGIVW